MWVTAIVVGCAVEMCRVECAYEIRDESIGFARTVTMCSNVVLAIAPVR